MVKQAFVYKRVPDTQPLQVVRTVALALGKAFARRLLVACSRLGRGQQVIVEKPVWPLGGGW